MVYEINNVEITETEANEYFDKLIGKIFAILAIYEDCTLVDEFNSFDLYMNRVMSELGGFYEFAKIPSFISLCSILMDVHKKVMKDSILKKEDRKLTHKKVKSLIFHCISIVEKEKVV